VFDSQIAGQHSAPRKGGNGEILLGPKDEKQVKRVGGGRGGEGDETRKRAKW
jgi:hypothetical protein